jgi:hypothetical protein
VSRILGVSLLGAAVLLSTPAFARGWVEKTVESDSVTVDLERDGTAVVAHEILLHLRGGPLPEITAEPVAADAELLDGATSVRAESGRDAGYPLPLTTEKDGAKVTLHVVGIKGLRSGNYLVRFRYRTNLANAGKIHPSASGAVVEFDGLRFSDGIDSERVVFRVPRSSAPPRLPSSSGVGGGATAATEATDDRGGVFLSTVRRAADKDEIEVVRPHVAKDEVVEWRVVADAASFDLAAAPAIAQAAPADVPPALPPSPRSPRDEAPRPLAVALSLLAVAIVYGAVVALKSRWVAADCAARRAEPRPLVRLPTALRAAGAGILLAAGVASFLHGVPAWSSAIALVLAMAAATHLPPRLAAPLRGPGAWNRLDPESAFEDGPAERFAGKYFDVGSAFGFLLFASLLAIAVAASISIFRHSAYQGIALSLASAVLFPVFCTGRARELPPDPATAPRELLEWLMAQLAKNDGLEVHPIGRVPTGAPAIDEVRLLVTMQRAPDGVVAIEAGMDFHPGVWGVLSLPFVIVRVLEGSPAESALPPGLLWTRGRTADERVTVLRPKVPTRRLVLALVREVVARLEAPAEMAKGRQAGTRRAKSAGSSSVTAKAGTRSSPAHAT